MNVIKTNSLPQITCNLKLLLSLMGENPRNCIIISAIRYRRSDNYSRSWLQKHQQIVDALKKHLPQDIKFSLFLDNKDVLRGIVEAHKKRKEYHEIVFVLKQTNFIALSASLALMSNESVATKDSLRVFLTRLIP